jgi:hypothetical protein
MDISQLQCRACKNPLRETDINETLGIARCSRCHAVLDLRRGESPPDGGGCKRPVVALPERFEVGNDRGTGLRITWRWFERSVIYAAFWCVAWDGFLVVWYNKVLTAHDPALAMILLPIAHVAVGVGLTYSALAGFLNKTVVTANSTEVRIKHGPMPWSGNQTIPAVEIQQVFCREVTRGQKHGISYSYNVHILGQNGTERTLLSGLAQVEQAVFIEQQLERYLRITDGAVLGEVER